MHDAVIGVFNIESNTQMNFDERDEELAALFGEYVAMAMHMLHLLVVEFCSARICWPRSGETKTGAHECL